MKQIYLLLVAILISDITFSQTVSVLDKSTLQPIPHAIFSNSSASITLMTDDNGIAEISQLKNADTILVSFSGYQLYKTNYEALSQNGEILLSETSVTFNEIIVSANRFEEEEQNVAQPIEVVNSRDLTFRNSQTSADVLQNTGNVFVQKSQLGGGSPVIHGFETNKVLIVVDGIRMNNAIYRGGHLQNVITLDNAAIERLEILYGPGSVMYGSDALGGVMNFFTKNPKLSSGPELNKEFNAFVRYATAAEEKTAHLDFNLGSEKLGSFTSFTYSDFNDLEQGSVRDDKYPDFGKRLTYAAIENGEDIEVINPDPDVQVTSGYSQYDFLQKATFIQNDHVSHTINFQYSTSSDVPRYDRLTETSNGTLKYAQWYYGPQNRVLGSYSLLMTHEKGLFDDARIVLAYQNIEESRHDRRFNNDNLHHRTEQLDILTFNADFGRDKGKSKWRYGLEGTYNHVKSTAFNENIVTGEESPLDTRYPDGGSDVSSTALYLSNNYHVSENFIVNAGVRASYNYLKSVFEDKTFFPFPYDEVIQKNTILSGSLGMVLKSDRGWRMNFLASTGFRAPNVDDLSKVFESVPGSVVVPNPNLGPENTYNVDLGLSKTVAEHYSIGVEGYYTWYENAITTQPGTFNGESEIIYDGELSQVTMNVNAKSAYLYGGSAYVSVDITNALSVYSTINYTYARITSDSVETPHDHIPPLFGKTSLDLKIKKFRGELYSIYNGWKKLEDYNLDGEDNLPFATPEGMPSWVTFNVRGSYQVTRNFTLQLGVENILDENYRAFASNISAPGRNFIMTLRGSW